MATSRPFPYVGTWTQIDEAIGLAMEKVLLSKADVQKTLDEAVTADQRLAQAVTADDRDRERPGVIGR